MEGENIWQNQIEWYSSKHLASIPQKCQGHKKKQGKKSKKKKQEDWETVTNQKTKIWWPDAT